MTTSGKNLRQLAQEGNPEVISNILNRYLNPKKFSAKVRKKDTLIEVMVEGISTPPQQPMVDFLVKGLSSLELNGITKAKIYGRQAGEDFPSWSEEVVLTNPVKPLPEREAHNQKSLDPSVKENVELLLKKGLEQSQGKNEDAIKTYTDIINLNPICAEAYFMRGSNKVALDEIQSALEDFSKAIEIRPDYGQAHHEYAMALFVVKDFRRAIEEGSKAIDLGVNYASTYNIRGAAYESLSMYKEAITDFSQAISIDPSEGIYYQNRSLAYRKDGDIEKAEQDLLALNKLTKQNKNPASQDAFAFTSALLFSFPILSAILTIIATLFFMMIWASMIPWYLWIILLIIAFGLFSMIKSST
ncbi:hypothetical protein C7293_03235 [filamentous cyanobacterium CCT1]|nr:hypothetical protein C7293_03235 [filamentous cyanobacterium CCT1]PSN81372.1 hypothetical protein C8B47_01770 [filamentous cyanobacterium CCP4]